jgi:hypothetical protein
MSYYCDKIKKLSLARGKWMQNIGWKVWRKEIALKTTRRQQDDIEMDLTETVYEDLGWIHPAQDRDQ